ncbi:F0F1 ATP synthase subunit delta [soil metagenome]
MASGAAKRYAQAVFQLGKERGTLDRWSDDLAILSSIASEPQTLEYLLSPNHSEDEKVALTDRALAAGQPEARNLARMLVQRRRVPIISEVAESFTELWLEERGIAIADVTTAVALDAESERRLKDRLGMIVGRTIELRAHVDPSIIGGIVARIGDTLIDGSISNRLRRLHERLAVGA